jgi:ribosome-associated translation inhibitor RaiA
MQIQINTDRNIQGHESVTERVNSAVSAALGRFSDRITRVEVHVSDENAGKTGQNDKRCMMEVRLEGRPPIAVTDQADALAQAIDGAADKMAHLLDRTFGKLYDHRKNMAEMTPPDGTPPEA